MIPLQLALLVLFISCNSDYQKEEEQRAKINKARKFLYENQIDEADQILIKIDTSILDEYRLALYDMTQSFLFHLKGDRTSASRHLRDCALYFDRNGNEEEKGEINLLNGFILERTLLRTEAAKSYLKGLQFFNVDKDSDKYFKCLLGVIRTVPKSVVYLNEAETYVKNHPSNKNRFLYLSTKSTITRNKREKLNIMLKSLSFFDEEHHTRNLVRLYSNIAKTYQSINNSDSANFYISLSEKLIHKEEIEPQTLVHYYLIRAYIERKNEQYEKALLTLSDLFEMEREGQGLLGYAFLLRSDIYKSLGDFAKENEDLKEYIAYLKQEYNENKLHQIGLLKIQLELSRKDLELERTIRKWLLSIVLFITILVGGGILFKRYHSRIKRKRYELEILNRLIKNRLYEQLNVNLNKIGKSIPSINEISQNKSTIKISGLSKEEFNSYFNIHHPFFRNKLSATYPFLSSSDLKYCDCILADLSVYQTKCILGVTESSVKKARKKLKGIFNCNSTTELFLLLKKLDESTVKNVSLNGFKGSVI